MSGLIPKRIIILLILIVNGLPHLSGQNKSWRNWKILEPVDFPYSFNPKLDFILGPATTALFVGGGWMKLKVEPMNQQEILALDAGALNKLDAPTIENWNPGLNTLRESFEPLAILAGTGLVALKGAQSYRKTKSLNPALTLLTMYSEGLFLSQGILWIAKAQVQRARPYAYNHNLSLEFRASSGTNNESFFSGNATVLFYSSTFISQVISDLYPDQKWTSYPWIGSYALSVFSGYLSVKSGMHYPSDVITGALWGAGTAFLVTRIHKTTQKNLAFFPWTNKYGTGATIWISI